jgi:hypothetical protein
MTTPCARLNDDSAEILLTPEELAQRLKVKRSWVYMHANELGVMRLGKYLRFAWPETYSRLSHVVLKPTPNAAVARQLEDKTFDSISRCDTTIVREANDGSNRKE